MWIFSTLPWMCGQATGVCQMPLVFHTFGQISTKRHRCCGSNKTSDDTCKPTQSKGGVSRSYYVRSTIALPTLHKFLWSMIAVHICQRYLWLHLYINLFCKLCVVQVLCHLKLLLLLPCGRSRERLYPVFSIVPPWSLAWLKSSSSHKDIKKCGTDMLTWCNIHSATTSLKFKVVLYNSCIRPLLGFGLTRFPGYLRVLNFIKSILTKNIGDVSEYGECLDSGV